MRGSQPAHPPPILVRVLWRVERVCVSDLLNCPAVGVVAIRMIRDRGEFCGEPSRHLECERAV